MRCPCDEMLHLQSVQIQWVLCGLVKHCTPARTARTSSVQSPVYTLRLLQRGEGVGIMGQWTSQLLTVLCLGSGLSSSSAASWKRLTLVQLLQQVLYWQQDCKQVRMLDE